MTLGLDVATQGIWARFRAGLPAGLALAAASREAELAPLLEARCAAARAAHPALTLDTEALAEAIAGRTPADGDLADVLRTLRAADFYLARACAAGDPAALAAFEPVLSAEVAAAARSVRASVEVADEVGQRLRVSLLVGDAERGPAIADYAGRGDLRGFLRISAARECLRVARRAAREVGMAEDDLGALAEEVDPELERLKVTYRQEFAVCFETALAALEPRERTLLRHQVFDRLSIDQIGALHGVHRATAARWLERARVKLAERTEELLAERLALDTVEVASVVRLVRSQLDVSLGRLLEAKAPE